MHTITTAFDLRRAARRVQVGLLGAVLLVSFATVRADDLDLDLLIEYRTVIAGNDGITRSSEYVERFTRRASRVWAEKVMPDSPANHVRAASVGPETAHQHLDLGRAARSIERLPDGRVIFTMVNVPDRLVVDIAPPEHPTVGFNGSWQQNFYLIAPESLRQMQRLAAPAGATRYELSNSAGTTKILWDDRLQYPREIVSVSKDGRTRQSMIARVAKPAAVLPWYGIERFDRRSLADFSD